MLAARYCAEFVVTKFAAAEAANRGMAA